MAKLNEAFPSKYLKAPDLNKRRMIVTIDFVAQEKINDDTPFIMHFKEEIKPLILNKTNFEMTAMLLQLEDSDDWGGHQIILRPDRTKNPQGQVVDCIRVDSELPSDVQQPAAPQRTAVRPPAGIPPRVPQKDLDESEIPF